MSNVVFVTPHPAPLAAAHDLPTLWGGQQWTSRAVARAVLTTKMATLSPPPGAACCGARPPHSVARSDCRMTVFVPQGVDAPNGSPAIAHRPLPSARFIGRHLQWPGRIRALRPNAFFSPAGVLPLRRIGCPTVITVHDLAIYRKREWFPAGQPLSTGWIVPRSLRNADRVIAVSQNTASDLQALFGVPASRISVVHEGVSKLFRPLGSEDLKDARARLKLPERFILFVSTIEPRKNLETLLEAWAMMRDRPDLVVVGGWGWRYEGIRARMQRLGPGLRHLEGLDRKSTRLNS